MPFFWWPLLLTSQLLLASCSNVIREAEETFSTIEPLAMVYEQNPPSGRSAATSGRSAPTPKDRLPTLQQDFMSRLFSKVLDEPTAVKEPLDPDRGLENVNYLEYLLINFPMGRGLRPRRKPMDMCDPRRYKTCTCIDPPVYTEEGRGNCNVGSTKLDQKVWCYVNPNYGSPLDVCPDTQVSEVKDGYFWSRFACITSGMTGY